MTKKVEKEAGKLVKKVNSEPKFSYEAIISSKKFTGAQRSLLSVILKKNKDYGIDEVESILAKELKKVVK